MSKSLDNLIFSTTISFQKIYITLMIILFLCQLPNFDCGTCSSSSKIKEGDTCFNEIIKIDGRSGQFSIMKDGSLLIEYSMGGRRTFYGLKQNGRGAFPNDESIYNLNQITKDNGEEARYESKNCLVYLSDDTSHSDPYIFSVSS